jgi:hypothetical protein
MSIGHVRPSTSFNLAVGRIESHYVRVKAPSPKKEIKEPEKGKNERNLPNPDRSVEEISVPLTESEVAAAPEGNSTSNWKDRIESIKRAKKPKKVDENG